MRVLVLVLLLAPGAVGDSQADCLSIPKAPKDFNFDISFEKGTCTFTCNAKKIGLGCLAISDRIQADLKLAGMDGNRKACTFNGNSNVSEVKCPEWTDSYDTTSGKHTVTASTDGAILALHKALTPEASSKAGSGFLRKSASVELGAAAANYTCKNVTTQKNFNIEAYAAGKWHIQQQAPTQYLPASENYCASAEYKILEKPNFMGYTIGVHNIAVEQNGMVHDSGSKICAYVPDSSAPAKLAVAPCLLPKWLAGPYWVIAYDETEGYALISGGQPTVATPGGCRTGTGVNGSGLWIFTRKQDRDEQLVQKVRALAKAQGFDLSVLNDVDQEIGMRWGCNPNEEPISV